MNLFIKIKNYFTHITCTKCGNYTSEKYKNNWLYDSSLCSKCGKILDDEIWDQVVKQAKWEKEQEYKRLVKAIKQAIVEVNSESKPS